MSLGKADAPVTIIEYASMTCPHCAAFHAETMPKLKSEFIDKGKSVCVFRPFPLNRWRCAHRCWRNAFPATATSS